MSSVTSLQMPQVVQDLAAKLKSRCYMTVVSVERVTRYKQVTLASTWDLATRAVLEAPIATHLKNSRNTRASYS